MINLLTSEPNIRYFSGFTGNVAMLIMNGKRYSLIVDGRYTDQARSEVKKGIKVIEAPLNSTLLEEAIRLLKGSTVNDIGYEDDKIDAASFNKLKEKLPKTRFHSISKYIRDKRCVKEKNEIEIISKAALIADLTYDCLLRIIKPGMTEKDISAQIDYLIKTFKGDFPAFETLVSSGGLSAYPHGKPTDKKIEKGDLVVIDFGARYKGYNSDMTRMISVGIPSKKQTKLYAIALAAQEAAIAKVKHGIPACEVDKAARDLIKKAGYVKYFKHATGHGIGLQVHEGPRVSMNSKDVLKTGMIITIEPGFYMPGFGGFRVEDMVVVTKNGCEVLTRASKKLETI